MLVCTEVDGEPGKKPKKDGGKSAVVFTKMYDSWVAYPSTQSRPESSSISRKSPEVLGPIRRGYDSQELRSVMQTSEKTKVRGSGKFKSKFFISAVLTL